MKDRFKTLPGHTALGLAIIASGTLVTASCAQDEPSGSEMNRQSDAAMEMRKEALERKDMERVEMEESTATVGEVPDDILDKAYAELEKLVGANRSEFELVRAEYAHWADGSMGCPEPGMNYTMAPVQGYWVVLRYAGAEFDFRGNKRGYFRHCRGPSLPGRTGPTK